MAEYTLCWHTEIASSVFSFFAVVNFYFILFFYLPLSIFPYLSPILTSFLPFSVCFVFLLRVRTLNLEIKNLLERPSHLYHT